MGLPSCSLEWVGVVTIGPPVTDNLEGRLVRVKMYLSRFSRRKTTGLFMGLPSHPLWCVGTVTIGSPCYGRSRSSGLLGEDGLESIVRFGRKKDSL